MPTSRPLALAAAASLAAALSACGSTSTPTPAAPASSTSPATAATVKTASTSLGSVVVDASGMTLYMYTKDTKGSGTSACTGQCLTSWPPLVTTGTPTGDGVTGTLGTIPTADGKQQVTLDGWPLYHWAKDSKPGDVTGQNVGKVWFVVDPAGTPVRATATGGPTA